MRKVGIFQYLNALPLIAPYLFKDLSSPFEWILKSPKGLNQMMQEKALDVSFVSSLFYLENRDQLDLIPGLGVGADGPVGSVSLFYPEDLSHFNGVPVCFDGESKTSNGILKWYFEKIRGEKPHFVSPQSLGSTEPTSFLLIGDRCLDFGHPQGLKKIDLAEEWKSSTNLPLPFSVLVTRKGFSEEHPEEVEQVRNTLLAGLLWSKTNLSRLVDYAKPRSKLSSAQLISYWKNLRYVFDSRDETALDHLERDVLKRIQGVLV